MDNNTEKLCRLIQQSPDDENQLTVDFMRQWIVTAQLSEDDSVLETSLKSYSAKLGMKKSIALFEQAAQAEGLLTEDLQKYVRILTG